jgi:HEAT repeat protein
MELPSTSNREPDAFAVGGRSADTGKYQVSQDVSHHAGEFDQLIAQLRDPDRVRRVDAALALGKLRAPPAIPALIELLQENDTVFCAGQYAAWALGEIGDAQAVGPLIEALDKQFVRGPAIEALVKIYDERAVEPLVRLFEETHVPSLAKVLGNWGDLRALDALVAAMQDPDPHVRFYTARALGKLGDRRALPVLEWAEANDAAPIDDTRSIRGKSVSYIAGKAIQAIRALP